MFKCQLVAKFVRISLPHLGLIFMVLSYTLIGALVLISLEGPIERRVIDERSDTLTRLYDEFMSETWKMRENITEMEREAFDSRVSTMLMKISQVHDKDFSLNTSDLKQKWHFPASVVFAITLLGGCGYEFIYLRRPESKLFSIFFTMVGIPLLLLTAADLGTTFAEFTTTFRQNLKQHIISICQHPRCRLCTAIFPKDSSSPTIIELDVDKSKEDLLNGATVTEMSASQQVTLETTVTSTRQDMPNLIELTPEMTENSVADLSPLSNEEDENSISGVSLEEGAKPKGLLYPMTLYICVMCSYCAVGAFLFMFYEREFSFIHGFHFAYNLIITVGLGNVDVNSASYLMFVIIYILCGFGILTICINLASEHLINYFTQLHYYGLPKPPDMFSDMNNLFSLLTKSGRSDLSFLAEQLAAEGQKLDTRPYVPSQIIELGFIDEVTESARRQRGAPMSRRLSSM